MTDFRALCAELVDIATAHCNPDDYAVGDCAAVLTRARAALAPPEPTDEELLRMAASEINPYESCGITIGEYEAETGCAIEVYGSELIAFARAVLTRWGRPAIKPVPVAERLPRPEDCDAETGCAIEVYGSELIAFARAVLTRWGRPAIKPVPVAERLPRPEDCDPSSQCWWFTPSEEKWIFWPIKWASPECSHWLPHHALPVPQQEVE